MVSKTNEIYPGALNLFFTGKCNLNCHYCCVDKSGQENVTLDEKSLKKSVDIFLSYPSNYKMISFVGGEPTLEFALIKKIYSYALKKAKEKNIFISMAVLTNGTLLNQAMVDYFIKNEAILKISIDGDKKTNDKNRSFEKNKEKSSFDMVIGNIKRLNFKNLKVSASLVFTPQNLNKLVKNIVFLNSLNFYSIEFYPELYAFWGIKNLVKMEKVFCQLEDYYKNLFYGNEKVFKNFQLGTIVNDIEIKRKEQCEKLTVDALGNFYVCDKVLSLPDKFRKKYIIGSVTAGLDNSKRISLLKNINGSFLKESGLKCESCVFYKYCFCLLGQYSHFSEVKEKKLIKTLLKEYCLISRIYLKTFFNIKKDLKDNSRFNDLYET